MQTPIYLVLNRNPIYFTFEILTFNGKDENSFVNTMYFMFFG